jgi:hypothetical protein
MLDLFAARLLVAVSTLAHATVLTGAVGAPVVAELCARSGWDEGSREWWARAQVLHRARLATGSILVLLAAGLFPGLLQYAVPLLPPLLLGVGALIVQGRMLRGAPQPGAAGRVALLGVLALAGGLGAATWLQVPSGLVAGSAPPWAALTSAALPLRWLHFLIGALVVSTSATVTRWAWRPESRAQPAVKAALTVLLVLLVLQAGAGVASTWQVSALQPTKIAAMTAAWKVQPSGALRIFGLPEEWVQETRFGVRVPGLAQALGMSTDGTHDLRPQPAHLRPWVAASYALFHLKVVGWAVLLLLGGLLRGLAGRLAGSRAVRLVAYLLVVPAVLAFLSGVVVGELGRQPWLVAGEMFVGEGFVGVPGTAWSLLLLIPGGVGLVRLRRALAGARKPSAS